MSRALGDTRRAICWLAVATLCGSAGACLWAVSSGLAVLGKVDSVRQADTSTLVQIKPLMGRPCVVMITGKTSGTAPVVNEWLIGCGRSVDEPGVHLLVAGQVMPIPVIPDAIAGAVQRIHEYIQKCSQWPASTTVAAVVSIAVAAFLVRLAATVTAGAVAMACCLLICRIQPWIPVSRDGLILSALITFIVGATVTWRGPRASFVFQRVATGAMLGALGMGNPQAWATGHPLVFPLLAVVGTLFPLRAGIPLVATTVTASSWQVNEPATWAILSAGVMIGAGLQWGLTGAEQLLRLVRRVDRQGAAGTPDTAARVAT